MGKKSLKPNQPNEANAAAQEAARAQAAGPERQIRSESHSTSGGDMADYADIMSGFRNFANTGGFSPEDIAQLRARSISPIRSVYSSAQRDLNRQRSLQGGYMPNYAPALARMAREQSMSQAEATTNANAGIAEMVAQNRLSGLQGMLSAFSAYPSSSSSYGYEDAETPEVAQPEQKKGFWSKFGGVLKKIGQVALPVALSPIPGGSIAGGILGGIGGKKKQPSYGPGY